MLTQPDLAADSIIACLHEQYEIDVSRVTFLPLGADINAAVYRIDADDGAPYFLKVRRGSFDEVAVAVPAFLHAQGIRQVMAPISTRGDRLWVHEQGFDWILYPYFEGHNGIEAPLSDAQWGAFGQSLKAVHSIVLPPELSRRVPREDYAPRWRDIVKLYDGQVEHAAYEDPIAGRFAAFWVTKRQEISAMVERAEQLGRTLRARARPFVLCHTDLHAWNVLLGVNGELAIVDWDDPLFAPKERDLMFVGGGVGAVWDSAHEEALFYQGYGPIEIDPLALAYYRYERIVADLAAYGAEIFEAQSSEEDRENGLRQVMGQFLPNRVVEIAHRTYEQLP
jgi:spectinomycin phosphotransferase